MNHRLNPALFSALACLGFYAAGCSSTPFTPSKATDRTTDLASPRSGSNGHLVEMRKEAIETVEEQQKPAASKATEPDFISDRYWGKIIL